MGLPAIKPLVAAGVRTNATLIFNPTQALLAGTGRLALCQPLHRSGADDRRGWD